MIVGIEGNIVYQEPTYVHINVNGIIYKIWVSLNCSSTINTTSVKFFTTYIVKEDSQSLYGFIDKNEKKLFDTVIKINGVGPKVALAICSTFTPNAFAKIVSNKDVSMLKKVPGIGAKGASRILVDLSGFLVDENMDTIEANSISEASQALKSLGFKQDQIHKALIACSSNNTPELVKEALKRLQK
ncbi:Holliday junction DNA helicase RuvA [hydrothermal vent metagenome]|uniref:Holliday junction DNA helicase RuvA n=1 Tax=hydrothermal vent metagenome TaxID=652676 RepID=A0A3B1E5M9_9ZZZZ